MRDQLRFRQARELPPGEIVAFWRANDVTVSPTDTPGAVGQSARLHPDLFLVAVNAGGAVAGTVWGTFDGRRGYVVHLAVRRDLRSLGLGGELMERVERAFAARGVYRIHLFVETFQRGLADFYAKRGFAARDDILVMSKTFG